MAKRLEALMFPVHSSTTLVSLALSVGNYFVGRMLFYICPGFYFLSMSSCCKSLLERGIAVVRLTVCLQPFLNPWKNQQDYVLSVVVSIFWALVYSCGEGLVSGFPAVSKFDVCCWVFYPRAVWVFLTCVEVLLLENVTTIIFYLP